MTRDEIRSALSDRVALVCTLLGECANQPMEGKMAVASVIRNRCTAKSSYRDVCLQPAQFSCWTDTGPDGTRVYQLAEALITKQPVGEANVISELCWIADGVMANQIRDHAAGVTNYITSALYRSNPPGWAKRMRVAFQLGDHVFLAST